VKRKKYKADINLKLSISVAIVSSSVFDELLGIPYPASIFLKFGWVEGVNIGAASGVYHLVPRMALAMSPAILRFYPSLAYLPK